MSATAIIVILTLTTWYSATAVTVDLTRDWGQSGSQIAWLTNAVQLGFVIGAILSAFLSISDVFSLVKVIAVSAALAGLFNALLLLQTGPSGAILARFFTGMALAGVYPPALKLMATWFTTGRGLALGLLVGALTLGSALPYLLQGFGAGASWRAIVVLTSIMAIAAGVFALFTLGEGPAPFAKSKVNPRLMAQVVRQKSVMLANYGYFGHMWELYAMWGWFLAYSRAASESGLVIANASWLTFAVIAAGAPGCVFGGWLADRIGRCRTTALMMAISGSSALLIGFFFAGPTWIFVTVALIWGATVVADSAQFSAAVTELSDPRFVGSALAFQMGIGFSITIVAVWVTPRIADFLGSWQWAFLILLPGPILGILAMLKLRKHPDSHMLAGGLK